MDTFEAIRTLRSVREFDTRDVPDEIIERILNAGRLSGSSKNTQPWQFVVIKDRALLTELSKLGDYAGHLKGATFGIALLTEATKRAEYDAGRCSQNMMLAAWNDGVGSCIATMYRESDARRVLGIPDTYSIAQVISFGYPTAAIERPARKGGRKPLAELVSYDRWDNRKAAR